jgi:hypothetical protein
MPRGRFTQNFLTHPKITAHDLTVFSVKTVVRALTFTDELFAATILATELGSAFLPRRDGYIERAAAGGRR